MGLRWVFQFPVFVYDEQKRPRVWSPDFYMPKLGMYIECCGSEKFDYEYRENIYDINGIRVIFVHIYKECTKWKHYLLTRIREIEDQRHEEVINSLSRLVRLDYLSSSLDYVASYPNVRKGY